MQILFFSMPKMVGGIGKHSDGRTIGSNLDDELPRVQSYKIGSMQPISLMEIKGCTYFE
jgi:hypothetical protein